MNIYDFGSEFAQTYTERCGSCGRAHEISTQRDECPEYTTYVYVRCSCGGSVCFELPVN